MVSKNSISVASTAVTVCAGWAGYKVGKWLWGSEKDAHKTATRASSFAVGTIAAISCYKTIYVRPHPIEVVRDHMLRGLATRKLVFPQPFNHELACQLDQIVSTCPLTGQCPGFPVRDVRPFEPTRGAQIYDWPALQYVLDKPVGERRVGLLKAVEARDFAFCEDLCLRIHRILYDSGLIRSADPIEALKTQIIQEKELAADFELIEKARVEPQEV